MEVDSLTASCQEKDQQLQEAQQSILKFKRVSDAFNRFADFTKLAKNMNINVFKGQK